MKCDIPILIMEKDCLAIFDRKGIVTLHRLQKLIRETDSIKI